MLTITELTWIGISFPTFEYSMHFPFLVISTTLFLPCSYIRFVTLKMYLYCISPSIIWRIKKDVWFEKNCTLWLVNNLQKWLFSSNQCCRSLWAISLSIFPIHLRAIACAWNLVDSQYVYQYGVKLIHFGNLWMFINDLYNNNLWIRWAGQFLPTEKLEDPQKLKLTATISIIIIILYIKIFKYNIRCL